MNVIEIKKDLVIVARGTVCQVAGHRAGGSIAVVSLKDNHRFEVSLEEIEFLPAMSGDGISLTSLELDDLIQNASADEMELAQLRFNIIQEYSTKTIGLEEAIERLGCSRSNFFRLKNIASSEVGFVSLLRYSRGVKVGTLRLNKKVEDYIRESIDKEYKGGAATIASVWRDVEAKCIRDGASIPSMSAVRRRIKMQNERELFLKKHGHDATSQIYDARPGRKETSRPLEWTQMDHTLVDVILVDADTRQPIGRPWLTVIIDLYTRVILGYYLSLHPPSTLSVACAIYHAALPKYSFLTRLGIDVERYPHYGIPEVIHMDNAKEFRSKKFERACRKNKITPKWRPLGKKHYGGHVERLIGSFMTDRVHFLPGTTLSNVVKRRGRDSEKASALTFKEFTRWFAREVCIYHGRVHSALRSDIKGGKCSPSAKWGEYYCGAGGMAAGPAIVGNPLKFKLDFMPEKTRAVKPVGISLHGGTYWDGSLSAYVGRKNVVIKYDPFSLQTIWALLDGEYIPVRYSDSTKADVDYEEYRAGMMRIAGKESKQAGALEDASLIDFVFENKELIKISKSETKRRRKAVAAVAEYLDGGHSPNEGESASSHKLEKSLRPDYSKRAKEFKGKCYD